MGLLSHHYLLENENAVESLRDIIANFYLIIIYWRTLINEKEIFMMFVSRPRKRTSLLLLLASLLVVINVYLTPVAHEDDGNMKKIVGGLVVIIGGIAIAIREVSGGNVVGFIVGTSVAAVGCYLAITGIGT